MSLGSEDLRRIIQIIRILYHSNQYPPGEGTARQRRRRRQRFQQQQRQVAALSERIFIAQQRRDPSGGESLAAAFDQLVLDNQQLVIETLPDPPQEPHDSSSTA
ncbi:rev protein [Simian immunodeficiency virus - agm.tan-1]|uniref:Protein Rev n=1 Tax=Simian immunodeficiency virus AGM.tantalus TaxID=349692 RepID=P89908_SIVTA|nr:rev protein [Simian immunodeficiency virus - agm.tan-1]